MDKLLTTVFGEKCYFCGEEGRIICYKCESKINLCKTGVCIYCQKETVYGYTHKLCEKEYNGKLPVQLCSVYEYGGLIAQIIRKSKYNPKRFALLRSISSSAVRAASKFGYDFRGYTVIPIPISKAREKDRGFNQANIVANAVCKEFGLSADNSVLARAKDTSKQFGLDRAQRSKNIKGAFEVRKDISGKKFLLVDDICTTGATLIEAAGVLYDSRAGDVACFTLSRKI